MAMVTLSDKGQITLNKDIRQAMGAASGDKLLLIVTADGRLEGRAIKARPLASLAGVLRSHIRGTVPEDLDDAIRQSKNRAAANRHKRLLEQE